MSHRTQSSDLGSKVFVLGVGAQRSGSSWLHTYLSSHRPVCMSEVKELHYFDALWREDHRDYIRNRLTLSLENLKRGIDRNGRQLPPEVVMQRMRTLREGFAMLDGGDRAYIDFFRARVSQYHTHFGEITPAYSLLPAEGFQHIRSLFANMKVIFIMRDPVRRVHSALRLQKAPNEAFLAALKDPATADRTRYEVTIANLRAALPADSLFFDFYESLFCDASVRSLCDFLGLEFKPGEYGRHVNATTEQYLPLTNEQIRAGRLAFANTYAFCRREFGSKVPANWLS